MPTSLSWPRSIFSSGVRGILFLRLDFTVATVGFSLNNGSKGLILSLGLYAGRPFDEALATAVWVVEGSTGWLGAVLPPGWLGDDAWILEISDLGVSDGFGGFVSAGFAAGGTDFCASTGVSGAFWPGLGGFALGAG